jgi:ribulose-5-phosphate 4-epimerase/fuculose-1-phosphate aldolase
MMKLMEEREKIIEVSEKLHRAGVIQNGQGNISIFNPENGLIAITPSAVPYHERGAEDICVVDLTGDVIEGRWRPTTEMDLHLIFYQNRADVAAVIHTHPPQATVFGVIGDEPLPMILTEAAMAIGGAVPIAPYARPGSLDLAKVTFQAVGAGFTAIMAHHGLIAVGTTIERAFAATTAVEISAATIISARSMGREVHILEMEEVKSLRELYLGYSPQKK